MSLSDEDVIEILKIIDESGYDDVRIETGDLKLHVQKHADEGSEWPSERIADSKSTPAPKSPTPEPKAKSADQMPPTPVSTIGNTISREGLVPVAAPMLGVFYRAPSPGEKPFVEIGAKVQSTDTVCLVEVMKLFNSVKAGVQGTVREILTENGAMVEHDQTLMLIEPDSAGKA